MRGNGRSGGSSESEVSISGGGSTSFSGARQGAVILAASALVLAAAGCARRHSRPFGKRGPPDVVLVTIDTFRSDAPGFGGDTKAGTPNLDRLAREGVVFTDAHAQNVMTLPSHVDILTGLYPYQHGVRDNDGFRLDEKIPTIATELKARGYSTGAFIGAFPLDSRYGLSRGFDVYNQDYPEGAGAYDFKMAERPATEVVAAARSWFAGAAGHPRFLWVHVYDCHAPYEPPPPFDRQYAAHPYLGEVAAVDAALGPLFDDLRAERGRILLVVTGDHGEALGDHGELTHGLFAYEATLHIPLVLWAPGEIPPRRDNGLARHVDIAPTVLEAAGVPVPKNLPGVSLLEPRARTEDASYFESLSASLNRGWAPLRGELTSRYKYIELPIPELYDLNSDPREEHNLASQRPEEVRRLARLLPPEASATGRTAPSSEEAARLRSLGYLAGNAPKKESYGPEDDPKNLIGLDNRLHQVVDLYQRGRLEPAIAIAREIVRERRDMPTGYEFLSFVLDQAGRDMQAIAVLEEARKRRLLDDSLTVRLALLEAGSGRARDAVALLDPLSSSRNVDVLNALGIARARAGDVRGAIQAFEKAIEVAPREATAYQNIGITQLEAGRFGEALAALRQALATNPRLPRAWNAQGVALQRTGNNAGAIAAWKRAVDLDPEQYDALFNLALVAAQTGDRGTARAALSQFIRTAPPARYREDIAKARGMMAALSGP